MPSFRISITPSRRVAARFVTGVRRKILKALEEEGLKQTDIARAIGVHRSVINRELRGKKDITLGRTAELAWAMGRVPFFDLPTVKAQVGSNLPPPTPSKIISTTKGTQDVITPPPSDNRPRVITSAAA